MYEKYIKSKNLLASRESSQYFFYQKQLFKHTHTQTHTQLLNSFSLVVTGNVSPSDVSGKAFWLEDGGTAFH